MGLIRKTLMVGTGGVVRGSSKKQRVAKATLKESQAQTKLARQQLQVQLAQAQLLRDQDRRARGLPTEAEELAIARQRAAEQKAIAQANAARLKVERKTAKLQARSTKANRSIQGVTALPGWYPSPDPQRPGMRYWDGGQWTDSFS